MEFLVGSTRLGLVIIPLKLLGEAIFEITDL